MDSLLGLRKFIRSSMILGPICGTIATVAHVLYLYWVQAWDPAISLFQALVLFFGISFTVPTGLCLVRMTWFGLNESVRARETVQDIGAYLKNASSALDEGSVQEGKEILRDIRDFVRPELKTLPASSSVALDRLRSFKGAPDVKENGR